MSNAQLSEISRTRPSEKYARRWLVGTIKSCWIRPFQTHSTLIIFTSASFHPSAARTTGAQRQQAASVADPYLTAPVRYPATQEPEYTFTRMAASSLLAAYCAVLLLLALAGATHGHPPSSDGGSGLSSTFYDASCPSAHNVVRRVIQDARVSDPRIPASLIRLHFHDCFVQGCDASLLLDDDLPTIETEKTVPANNKSARGFEVVDDIKSALEEACPGVVSCADILALAAEISVELAGGPLWRVLLGRRDGTTTNVQSARNLPNFFDTLNVLQEKFRNVNLDDTDLVALQGAHTFGKVQCQFTRENCTGDQSSGALENLDQVTPNRFDNKYYGNLLHGQAQLPSDEVMLSDPAAVATTAPIVHRFASNQKDFFRNFAASMIKMGNISPLTGKDGEIRNNCRRVNGGY